MIPPFLDRDAIEARKTAMSIERFADPDIQPTAEASTYRINGQTKQSKRKLKHDLSRTFAQAPAKPAPPPRYRKRPVLTGNSARIAELVSEGKNTRQIAAEMGLTPGTVKTYVYTIFQRIGVHSRAQLTRWWITEGAGEVVEVAGEVRNG